MTSVCIAGATGLTGRALVDGVLALDREPLGVHVHPSVTLALDDGDVVVDYTSHYIVKSNTLTAIGRGAGVVIGSSGLTAEGATSPRGR